VTGLYYNCEYLAVADYFLPFANFSSFKRSIKDSSDVIFDYLAFFRELERYLLRLLQGNKNILT